MSFGVYNDMLTNDDGVQISQHLHLPEGSILCVWALFVHHDNTIQINSRLIGTSDHPVLPEQLGEFLTENLSLFEIMAEEDPEYHQMRVLQDAGVIPVIQPMRNLQPHDSHRG